jgi:hypothetical protein
MKSDTIVWGNAVATVTPEEPPHSENAVCLDTGYSLSNARANPVAAYDPKLEQSVTLGVLGAASAANQLFGGNLDPVAEQALKHLDPTPPDASAPIEHVEYQSTLQRVSADSAFETFTSKPNEVFGAVGITLEPRTAELKDGARLMLQEPGVTPPVWAPIEVRVDKEKREVRITTLDGHPLRGTNNFSFRDVPGGSELKQVSDFQLSSFASELGGKAMAKLGRDPIHRQHEIWQGVHAYVADHAERK